MAADNKAIHKLSQDSPKTPNLATVQIKQPLISKKEFLLNMRHEIRPSMNGVIGMAQLLRTTTLDATQQEYLDYLETSAKSLFCLINDILDLAKLDDGQPKLELVDFSLRGIINNIIKTQHADLHFKGIELVVDIPQTIPDIFKGDQLRTKQVLLNLLGNAIKGRADIADTAGRRQSDQPEICSNHIAAHGTSRHPLQQWQGSVEAFFKQDIDLILMDIQMPVTYPSPCKTNTPQ